MPEKNRAYLKIIGFWRNPEAVPDYLKDWTKATSLLTKGFTLLTDASEMKTHPQELRKLHEQAQAIILKAGVSKVAEILKDEVAELQFECCCKDYSVSEEKFQVIRRSRAVAGQLIGCHSLYPASGILFFKLVMCFES